MPVSCLIVSCCLCFACYLHACTRHLRRTSVSCMHALDCQLWAGPLPRVCAPKFDWSMKKSKITPDWAVNVIENTALWILTACWAWCVVECRHCTLSWTTAGSCCALIGRGHNDDQYQQQWDVDVWTRGVRPAGGCCITFVSGTDRVVELRHRTFGHTPASRCYVSELPPTAGPLLRR